MEDQKDNPSMNQMQIIDELARKVKVLEDTERRRQEWLHNAKREAGYGTMTSFDDVWKKTLARSKEPFKFPTDEELVNYAVKCGEPCNASSLTIAMMCAFAEQVLERLYESGDINTPTKSETEEVNKLKNKLTKIYHDNKKKES